MNKNLIYKEKTIISEEKVLDWLEVSKEVKNQLGKDVFESWIKDIQLCKEYNHYVILSVPTRFMRDWVVSRYADKILDVITKFKKSIKRVEFTFENINLKSQKEKTLDLENKNDNVSLIEDSILNYNRLDKNKKFENFVLGDSNRLAFTACKKVCSQLSYYNPLYIYGGVGMGKTHLLNSIGLHMQNSFKVMFISAERFMYHFIKSIKSNEMVSFKDFFRKSEVFIIDDIQFVRGKEAMQEEFFHTFNSLMERGSQIIISSDRSPRHLDRIQERIKSRFSGGLVVDIQSSDFNLRLQILKNKYLEIKTNYNDTVDLSEEILKFLASEMRVNIRELIGALNRIIAFSKIYKKSPNVPECKIILKDIIDTNISEINVENIQSNVAKYFKISLNEMLSARRSRSLVRPRQIAMYLSKKFTTKSLPEIGRKFSGRDHTTVLHAVKTVEKLMKINETINQNIEQIKEEFLRVN